MTNQFITSRGNKFFTICNEIKNPKGNILFVHGLGEHIGRYTEMIRAFNDIGLNAYGYDRRGEGRTHGHKALVQSIDNQVEDLVEIKNLIIKNDLSTFLYGHSLGGLIVTKYLTSGNIMNVKGVIISGALLQVDKDISPFLQKVSGIVSAIAPKLQTVKVDTNLLSRNPDIKPAYEADPYVYHGGTPARTGHQILQTIKFIQNNFRLVECPILITHGGGDKLADPDGSRKMYDGISSQDKTLKIFDGLYHEIMHEPERDMVIKTMTNWISSRV